MDYRDVRAKVFNKGAELITPEMMMRADCEIYEHHMIRENLWGDYPTWACDGVSDKYGHVDVKMILDKYWSIPTPKIRNIFRQKDIIDNYYFIRKVVWPDGPLIDGDEVEVEFLGVMSWDEVAARIEPSKWNGMYVDVSKYAK